MKLIKVNKKDALAFSAIIVLILICAIIQMNLFWDKDLVLSGDDMGFHFNRVFGLAEAIKTSHYPFYIDSTFLNGYGYATNWFYSNLFLFPMAILLNLGYSLVVSYRTYIIIYTIATACVTYYCTYKMSKKVTSSSFMTILYVFSLYRAFDVYQRAALGESLAFIFLPVILYGIYEILYGQKEKWYILTIGFTGMIYTHVLSSVLAFCMLLLFLLLSIHKLWEDKTKIIYFVIAGGVTILLSAFFIFPMVEQMASNTFYLNTYIFTTPGDTMYSLGTLWKSIALSNKGSAIIGLGYVLFLPLIYRFNIKEKNAIISFADKCLLIAMIFLLMTTNYFPWKHFHTLDFIQFTFRLFALVTLLMAFSCSIYIAYAVKKKYHLIGLLVIVLSLSISNTSTIAQYYKDSRIHDQNQFRGEQTFKDSYNIGAGSEYLPSVTKMDVLKSRKKDEVKTRNHTTKLSHIVKEGNELYINFDAKDQDILELPMIYYKGYEVKMNNKIVPLKMSNNGLIEVPIQGKGKIEVSYPGTDIQKFSFYTSITAFVMLMIFIRLRNKEKKYSIDSVRKYA
ncbi:YfhO family protein [Bacillus cereus group sp. BfR-BA-01380]|uniref:YfhO family protein n=1 Tax=Bacillus cereus group sp. BfR-BA-01380 TaxID=2920324 RepID=UPI001F55FF72|nr:YfhO family protein [Bacillus cereus group sp. BfR-BA-01380]